jgi:hypothetical protein
MLCVGMLPECGESTIAQSAAVGAEFIVIGLYLLQMLEVD